jgi:uncharacterized membrane protein YcaP (DUF421 family)
LADADQISREMLLPSSPLLPVLVVFVTLALLYRGIMWLMGHSEKLEDLLEGKPIVVVEEGQLAWEKLHAENMTEFEFFMELRVNSVEQLGQVRLAILETNGQISVFYYPDEEVRAGLSILPAHCTTRYTTIPQEGIYACVRCSIVMAMQAGEKRICPRCANAEWSKASRAKRLT